MEKLLNRSKIFIASLLILCLAICFVPTITNVIADTEESKLAISDILKEENKNQEITTSLPFNPTLEGDNQADRENGWQAAIKGNYAKPTDMTSELEIADTNGTKYSDIGAGEGNYSLLFVNTEKGVSAVESKNAISIPSRALYLLTFKVKVYKIVNNKGISVKLTEENANVSEDNLKEFEISNIKSTVEKDNDNKENVVYVSYAFLIKGSELYETKAKLYISLGAFDKDDDTKNTNFEEGIASVDDFKLFSLTTEQASQITGATNVTTANFSQISSNYNIKIANGAFNNVINQGYDYSSTKLFTPANWTQETLTKEASEFGIINTNSAMFSSKFPTLLNPGLTTYQTVGDIDSSYNNVLMLNNKLTSYQTVKSSTIALAKEKIYELSFEFCTPATKNTFAEETNSISFIVRDNANVIYKQENIYSYNAEDHAKDTATWKRLSLIIETADATKNLSFEIIFGTENNTKLGTVYIDNVRLDVRSEEKAFNNIYENKLQLKDNNTEFVEKGYVSLENVKNLKSNNIVSTYKFESKTSSTTDTNNKKDDTTSSETNLTYLWYVIPSALLAICTIGGIIVFYAQKIKLKPRKSKRLSNRKKSEYDRTKNSKAQKPEIIKTKKTKRGATTKEIKVEKTPEEVTQVDQNENEINNEQENTVVVENLSLTNQIEQLEKDYSEKKISLKKYLKERAKVEDKILKSKENQ